MYQQTPTNEREPYKMASHIAYLKKRRALSLKMLAIIVLYLPTALVACTRSMSRGPLPAAALTPPAYSIATAIPSPTPTPFVVPQFLSGKIVFAVFSQDTAITTRQHRKLYVVNANGDKITKLSDICPVEGEEVVYDIALSPNKEKVASYDLQGILSITDINTGNTERLTTAGAVGESYIAWSPTADRIAFVKGKDLYVTTVYSREETLLVRHRTRDYSSILPETEPVNKAYQISQPVWQHDGSGILYNDFAAPTILMGDVENQQHIYRVDADTKEVTVLYASTVIRSVSPAGNRLLVDIRRGNSTRTHLAQLVNNGLRVGPSWEPGEAIAWSPDNKSIVGLSFLPDDKRSQLLLLLVNADTAKVTLRSFINFERPISSIAVSPDSRYVAFSAEDTIWVANIGGSDPKPLLAINKETKDKVSIRILGWIGD